MPRFKIEITRIGYASRAIEVEAASQSDAQRIALETAGNHPFAEYDAEYQLAQHRKEVDYARARPHPRHLQRGCTFPEGAIRCQTKDAAIKECIADVLFQRGEGFLNDHGVDEKVCAEVAGEIAALVKPCGGGCCGKRPKRDPQVIVSVSGGVADVVRKSRGVELTIIDYDVDGEDEARLDRDADGQLCCMYRLSASESQA